MTATRRVVTYVAVAATVCLVAPLVLHVAFAAVPGAGSYVVSSSSMSPTLDAGDVVYVHSESEYDVGDVVTFSLGDRVVTHRIVAETPDGFVTAGDANDARDSWVVPRHAVVGRVVASIPLYGHLIARLTSRTGTLVLVGVPSLLLVVTELARLRDD